MKLTWDKDRRDKFSSTWPCCDIPDKGWVILNSKHDLIDCSDNLADCQPCGGINEFIDDLKKEALWAKRIKEQADYYGLTVKEYEKQMEELCKAQEFVDDNTTR